MGTERPFSPKYSTASSIHPAVPQSVTSSGLAGEQNADGLGSAGQVVTQGDGPLLPLNPGISSQVQGLQKVSPADSCDPSALGMCHHPSSQQNVPTSHTFSALRPNAAPPFRLPGAQFSTFPSSHAQSELPPVSTGFSPPINAPTHASSTNPEPHLPQSSLSHTLSRPYTQPVFQGQVQPSSTFNHPSIQPLQHPVGSPPTQMGSKLPMQPAFSGHIQQANTFTHPPVQSLQAQGGIPPIQLDSATSRSYFSQPGIGQPPTAGPPIATDSTKLFSSQSGFGRSVPIASSSIHAEQYQGYPASRSPSIHGLPENFSSLSVASAPGSVDAGIDINTLPRPLGDEKPSPYPEMYSMNCSNRYLRLTTNAIPTSQSLLSRWHLPLGAVVCPLAETPETEKVPVLNFASTGIIRCRRCRSYVNPYVTFTDVGRKWRCNFCSLLNDVPGDYFSHLDATGRRIDLDQRPELTNGSIEFVAPTEYMVRPPMPPLFFFLIDVSVSAVRSGMLEVIAHTIKGCLNSLPGYPRTQIGFITYDSCVHFYNLKSSLVQPQMMVVSDLDNLFVPLPDDLLVNLSDSRTLVEAFLDSIPNMFLSSTNVESAFGPALRAAFMVMSSLGGKLLIFQNTIPSLGVGRLTLRGDDHRAYGTDKEHTLRISDAPFYKQLAADFTKYQIGVNAYAFNDKYIDVASIGTLAKYTGGQVYHYPCFQSSIHGEKLRHELTRDLTRETAWEAVMRIRCGRGVRFTSYHGNFMLRSTDLLALPAVDCDKAFGMQLSLEETLLTTQTMYFQVALLYTASCGERRIRVHTAAAPVVSTLEDMYRAADTGAIISLLCRQAIEKSLSERLEDARSFILMRIIKAFREYRNLYAVQHRLGGRMIFPESLQYLPLYGLALCKSSALRGGYSDVPLDDRCAAGFTMMALPVKKLLRLLYPSLIRLDEFLFKSYASDEEMNNSIRRLPLSSSSLDPRGLYLFDDGFCFVIWFGKSLSPEVSIGLLGSDAAAESSKICITEQNTEMSRKLMTLIAQRRKQDCSYHQLCHILRQGEQAREGFLLLVKLVEDQIGGTVSYADWMLQIHRQMQQNA